MSPAPLSLVTCGICGVRLPAWGDTVYARSPFARPTVHASGMRRCAHCGRRGCASCLCALHEDGDEDALELFLCYRCLELHVPCSPPHETPHVG